MGRAPGLWKVVLLQQFSIVHSQQIWLKLG